jgi:hypothetical protein
LATRATSTIADNAAMNDIDAHNLASRQRLARLADRSDDDLARAVDADWTVAGLLAHLAFWDRMLLGRWRLVSGLGETLPRSLPSELPDLVNDAQLPEWRTILPRTAIGLALAAAEALDAYVSELDPGRVQAALDADQPRLVDRSRHRNDHLDAIERALA